MTLVCLLLSYFHGFLRSRHDLGLEILALRQQHPGAPDGDYGISAVVA